MRILQVTPYFAPAWAYGGPPRVMTDYAVGLAALGHQVDVFTTDVLDAEHRAAPALETIEGVRFVGFATSATGSPGARRSTCRSGSPPHSHERPVTTTPFTSPTRARS